MIIFSRPEYELPTRYASRWAEEVIKFARKKGHTCVDLYRSKANKKNIESYLTKRQFSLAMFNGHGSHDCIFGHDDEPLITAGSNEGLLEKLIVYSIACDSAQTLGPAAIKSGSTAYIGYRRKFWAVASKDSVSKPLKDKRAKLIFAPSNYVLTSLLKGHTVEKSVSRSKTMSNKIADSLMTSDATDNDLNDAMILKLNMSSQVFLGDGLATL